MRGLRLNFCIFLWFFSVASWASNGSSATLAPDRLLSRQSDQTAQIAIVPSSSEGAWGGVEALATVVLAVVTFALAAFTYKLWRSTGDLVREGHVTAKHQLRAYVAITAPGVHRFSRGFSPVAHIQIQNFGATPAYRFVSSVVVGVAKSFQEVSRLTERAEPIGHLAPGAVITIQEEADFKLTEEQMAALSNNELTLFVHGVIRYVDVFGEQHFTRIRLWASGRGDATRRLGSCEEGNETDDDPTLSRVIAAGRPKNKRLVEYSALVVEAAGAFLIFMEARRMDATFGLLGASFDYTKPIPGYEGWIYHAGVTGFVCLLVSVLAHAAVTLMKSDH